MSKVQASSGFTLVEIAIVVAIAGVILVASLQFALPIFEQARESETAQKIARIEEAIGTYAVKNYRIPCAADPLRTTVGVEPFGFERGSGVDGDGIGFACTGVNAKGIVPFKTLGLPEDYIYDGHGNVFTYAVTEGFTLNPAPPGVPIHPRCRTPDWYQMTSSVGPTFIHKNPLKARFCCSLGGALSPVVADPLGALVLRNSDVGILIEGQIGALATPPRFTGNSGGAYCSAFGLAPAECTDVALIDTPYPSTRKANFVPPITDQATGIAYVIISHGRNGLYAYDLGTGNPVPALPGVTTLESENNDNDILFNSFRQRRDRQDALAFDDVVSWQTQDMIFASQGESCAVP